VILQVVVADVGCIHPGERGVQGEIGNHFANDVEAERNEDLEAVFGPN
jgi:hypothetical protein